MKSNWQKATLLSILLSWCVLAKAVLDIEITQAIEDAYPIAVVPFGWQGEILPNDDVSEVVRNDLTRSGEFRPLNSLEMRQKPVRLEDINVDYWRQKGIESVVIGHVEQISADRYEVSFQLVDLFSSGVRVDLAERRPLIAKRFTVEARMLRQLGHHISDLIYSKVTGVKGAFSTQIAYVTTEWKQGKPHRYKLQIADVDGHNPRPILTSREPIMSPSWSPDGKQMAYVSFENHRAEIYISNIETGERKKISSFPGINGAPAWSPDGKFLALVLSKQNQPKIYILELASGKLRQLTQGWSIDTEPRWMPDGRSLVFTSNRGGKPQIYRVSVSDGGVERLTFTGTYNARASVTPDGQQLIMIHRGESSGFNIAVQDLKSGQVRLLTRTNLDESPTLSPNGRTVVYGTKRKDQRVLGAVSIDGRVKLQLPATDGDVQEPAWSPFLS